MCSIGRQAKVISFLNMKGGVGKTTLTINIGEKLAEKSKVLVIDMDPQFNATQSLLLYRSIKSKEGNLIDDAEELVQQEITSAQYYEQLSNQKKTILQIFEDTNFVELKGEKSLDIEIIPNLYLVPGDLKLSKEIPGDNVGKAGVILDYLTEGNLLERYDYILIDCPPTWSILTHASLVASDYYVIPGKVDFYSSIGIQLLEEMIDKKVKNDSMYKRIGRELHRLGIIFTLVQKNISAERIRKDNLKNRHNNLNFFNSEFGYVPSLPNRVTMINEVKGNGNYTELVNSVDRITTELLQLIEKVEDGHEE